jgi:hypothetical protein
MVWGKVAGSEYKFLRKNGQQEACASAFLGLGNTESGLFLFAE